MRKAAGRTRARRRRVEGPGRTFFLGEKTRRNIPRIQRTRRRRRSITGTTTFSSRRIPRTCSGSRPSGRTVRYACGTSWSISRRRRGRTAVSIPKTGGSRRGPPRRSPRPRTPAARARPEARPGKPQGTNNKSGDGKSGDAAEKEKSSSSFYSPSGMIRSASKTMLYAAGRSTPNRSLRRIIRRRRTRPRTRGPPACRAPPREAAARAWTGRGDSRGRTARSRALWGRGRRAARACGRTWAARAGCWRGRRRAGAGAGGARVRARREGGGARGAVHGDHVRGGGYAHVRRVGVRQAMDQGRGQGRRRRGPPMIERETAPNRFRLQEFLSDC